ncbi:MAG: hypothetical protein U0797_14005 [Gemmataceae bacterium]
MSQEIRPDPSAGLPPLNAPDTTRDAHLPARRSRNFLLLGWVVVPSFLLLAVLVYLLRGGGGPQGPTGPTKEREQENFLAQVRSTLGRPVDLATCRVVVQQLNAHLQQTEGHRPKPLPPGQAEKLTASLALRPDDLAELTSATFTPLDAHHLDACFLLRDAARSLELAPMAAEGKPPVRQSSLDRAAAGFAWVVRQVRLLPADKQALFDAPAPPAKVLRRGTGSPLERALVFLALLEQFGLDEEEAAGPQGCLVFAPDAKGQKRLWACGVAAGGDGLYLFDPRLGLPVPGPGGQGIATLAQAAADPAVLGQLKIDKLAYDVTADQAKSATAGMVCPLSAAAPRMRLLQDELLRLKAWRDQSLPSQVRVRLAEDPARALASVQKAVGKADAVAPWPTGATVLRRFLPKEEGGDDPGVRFEFRSLRGFTTDNDPRAGTIPRDRLFQLAAVPWEEYPPVFRNPDQFGFDQPLGQRLRAAYAGPFLQSLTDPSSPREQLLRGRFSLAVRDLVPEPPQLMAARARLQQANEKELMGGLADWVRKATAATAEQIRAKGGPDEGRANLAAESLWKWKGAEPIAILMAGAMAGPRAAEVMYQLALCRHEQAARHQARLGLAAAAGVPLPAEAANARKTWTDAEGYWKEFLDANPGRPAAPAGRRLRSESQVALGQAEEARKGLEDLSGPMTDLEKLASLWLARRAAQGGVRR